MLARVDAVSAALGRRFGAPPDMVIVLGSGLGAFAAALAAPARAGFVELGLPVPSVAGHAGTVSVGELSGRTVAVVSGRLHLYEGHAPADVVLGVRAFARWGVRTFVLSSAVGGVNPALVAGSLALVGDHLNLTGQSPLTGVLPLELGPRFPDLGDVYTAALRRRAQAVAPLPEAVYAAMPGPAYETPAEVRMLARLGADVVGMSLVPEAIALAHMGRDVLGLAVVANAAAGLTASRLTHAEVTAAMAAASGRVADFLTRFVAG